MSQSFASIHIAKSLKKADTQTKTCQRVCLPQHTDRLRRIKHENTTMYKNNSRNSSEFKGCSLFQLYRKLKKLSSEIGYYSYTYR